MNPCSRSRSSSRRSRRRKKTPNLTRQLERCHFRNLTYLVSRPRPLAIELATQALSLKDQHKRRFVDCIKDRHRHQWLVVADPDGVLWLTERHLVLDRHLTHMIKAFGLRPLRQEI